MHTSEFEDWLRRNDPEGIQLTSPAVYDGEERRQNNTLVQAQSDAMNAEFEQLKANEQWAMRQAQNWRDECDRVTEIKEWAERRLIHCVWIISILGTWALAVTILLLRGIR